VGFNSISARACQSSASALVLKSSFEQRRCLVPSSSYCDEKPATWHCLWTRYSGPLKNSGDTVEQEVFAFMTTEPNELTEHQPRAHAGAAH
jgi:putative SOS response-associated peptidase YedK